MTDRYILTDRSLLPFLYKAVFCMKWTQLVWWIVWWTSYAENSSDTITQFVIVITINKDMLQQQRKEPLRSIF